MITPIEFLNQWGAEGLLRYEPAALEGVDIPEVSKRFLVEAGLPRQADLELEFDLSPEELPTLPEALEEENLPAFFDRYRPIGVDTATTICLDERDKGRIYAVDIDGAIPTRFMNSSVPQLAEFLLVFRDGAGVTLPTLASEKELEASAQALEEQFRRIDPAVFSDEDNWWPLILTQRRDGML